MTSTADTIEQFRNTDDLNDSVELLRTVVRQLIEQKYGTRDPAVGFDMWNRHEWERCSSSYMRSSNRDDEGDIGVHTHRISRLTGAISELNSKLALESRMLEQYLVPKSGEDVVVYGNTQRYIKYRSAEQPEHYVLKILSDWISDARVMDIEVDDVLLAAWSREFKSVYQIEVKLSIAKTKMERMDVTSTSAALTNWISVRIPMWDFGSYCHFVDDQLVVLSKNGTSRPVFLTENE